MTVRPLWDTSQQYYTIGYTLADGIHLFTRQHTIHPLSPPTMLEIPVTKCMQLAIDDDISLPCIAFTDIDDNGVVNIMIGSGSGTIRAIRIDDKPSSIKPLIGVGRLASLTIWYQKGDLHSPCLLACSVDGSCNIISYRQKEGTEFLSVECKVDICFNCRTVRTYFNQNDYAVIGTEDGFIYVYEMRSTEFVCIGSTQVGGAVEDIVRSSCSDCLLHLLVSCEGCCCYEVEVTAKGHAVGFNSLTKGYSVSPYSITANEVRKAPPCNCYTYGHITWFYSPDTILCSCDGIERCDSIAIPVTEYPNTYYTFLLYLKSDHSLYLQDARKNEFRIDVVESVVDFRVQMVSDNAGQPRIILFCRDADFFIFYMDLLRYYESICRQPLCVCRSTPMFVISDTISVFS